MRKRILSFVLCFVMLISSVPVQVFAADEYLSDWEFTEGFLAVGDNTVAMVSGAEYTLIEFYPDETGIYTFEGPSGSRLANFNASFFPNNLTGDAATDTLEWTCTDAGQSLLLGICADGESVTVSVERTGDYVSHAIQYTVYENTHTPNAANKDYCAKASGKLTPADSLVKKGDRYYTESGEAIFVNFNYTNLSIATMLGTAPARYLETDADGNVVVAYDYYDALAAYAAMGNYPLTTDLEQMLRHLDIAKQWTEGGWLDGWQELCFLVKDHQGGEAVVEGNVANTYCVSCGKLLKSEEAKPKDPHAFGNQPLAVGSNTVALNSGAVYTLNKFAPSQTGVYTFAVPAGFKLANYNASFNPMDLTGDAATNTLEWTCSSVGQHILVGVSGSGDSVELTVTRTGDYVSHEIQYTVYENVHTPGKEHTDYCANVGGWFSVPSVVPQGDFFYGVTAEGEYIPVFVDLAYSDMNITTMLETSSAKYVEKDENGNVTKAIDYYNALKQYTAFGKYPLTQDLMQMLIHLDAAKGWTEYGWLEGWQELCFLAAPHAEGEPVIEGDLAKYYCTGCNKLMRTEEAPEEECKHPDLVHVEAVAPTCQSEGNIEHWYCEACETVWQDQALTQVTNHKNVILPVSDHDLVHVEAVAATCMNEGNIEHWYCKVCDTVWQDEALTQLTNHKNVIVPVADHDLVHVEAKEPTATENGNIEHWYCNVCEVVWQDEALTQVTNHRNVIIPAYPLGSPDHPDVFTLGAHTVVREPGDIAYHYLWTAPEDGNLTITLSGKAWALFVTGDVNADGFYDAYETVGDSNVQTFEIHAGQEYRICIGTNDPVNDAYPGGTVTFTAEFDKASELGTPEYPDIFTLGTHTVVREPGDIAYHYLWMAPESGTLTITLSGKAWALFVTGDVNADGFYDAYETVGESNVQTFEIHAGQEYRICIGTNDPVNDAYPGGTVTFTAEFSPECQHPGLEYKAAVEATCMAEGSVAHWYCPACGKTWLDEALTQAVENVIVPAAAHDLVHVEAVAASCMAEGSIEHWYCKVCEVVWQDEALTQITNHKNVIIPVAEHDLVHVDAVAASCMAEGSIEHWYCKVCEVVWQDEALTQITNHKNVIIPVAEHDLVHVEAVAASCMNEGNIEHWYCNVCEAVWQDEALTQITNHKNVIIPVADHDLVHVEAKEPTAAEDGNIEHWYCNVCEVVWQDASLTQITNHKNVIIPALGEPEIPGNTAEEYIPVDFLMNEDWTAGTATVTVEPGIWYYGAYIFGMELTANGEAVEVTAADRRVPVIFCFTNESTEAVTYELVASYPLGTMSNPVALAMGENAAAIEEGNDQGYYFTWTAQVAGTLTVTMPESNWFYTINNLTAGIYGDMQYSNSANAIAAAQLEVNAGDQIQVIVNNFDPANPWSTPAGTLTFQASFEEAILAPLALVPVADSPAEVVKQSNGSYTVYLDKEDAEEISPFSLLVHTLEPVSKKDLKWTVSDSRIASVKSEADSLSGIVTLKKGADGACVITLQNKKTKDEASVTIVIRSYEPRLESTSLTLNSNAHAGASVVLTESYGNSISFVTVHEYDSKTKAYAEEVSQRLFPAYEDGTLTLTHGEPMKKGTYKLLLKVTCENGETYEYKVSLKVTETLPTVTIKQLNKFNTFYTDSEAQFLITAKDANVIGAELFFGENPAFRGDFDPETGILTVRYSESYLNGETKLKVKGDIMVFCEGYWIPVEKATTISTEKKAPKLALTSSSATINTALNPDSITWVGVLDTNTDELLAGEDLWAKASFLEATPDTDGLKLKLTGKKGGSVSIYAQQDDWTEAVKLTFKLNVKTTKPSLKLTASTLKVNRLLPDYQEHTYYYLDQDNVIMVDCWIEPVSKKASVLAEAEKINVRFDGPVIVADLDPDNLPKKGTYEFKLTALVAGDVKLTKNFKVTVEEKLPTVKLKSATLKLNNQLGQTAYAETAVSATGLSYAYRLADLVPEKEYEQFRVCYDAETGILRTELLDGAAKAGKYKVKLYPKLESIQGSEVVLEKAVTVTVQIFSGKPSVTLKTTGKLDTIVPDSAVFYTITKLTNIAGAPEAVRLEGKGAELFNAELTENGAKITLNRDVQHQKDKTYKLKLIFTIDGVEVSANVSLKVNQSTVKFATVKTVNYCQSQSSRMAVNLVMTAPAGASVGDIALGSQTAKQLIAALGEDAISWVPMADGTYLVSIKVNNPGHLVYGKSYSLYLDVTPEGCAENAKPASVKITVKVAK